MTTSRPALILPSTVAFAIALIVNAGGMYNVAVLMAAIAYGLLFSAQYRPGTRGWLSDPLRIVLPMFLGFQLILWMRCLLVYYVGDYVDHRWQWMGFPLEIAPEACANYLLMHYPYFLFLCLGYRFAGRPIRRSLKRLDQKPLLVFSACFLIVSGLGFLFTYGRAGAFSPPVLYVTTNFSRFNHLWLLMLSLVVFLPDKPSHRVVALAIYTTVVAISMAVLIETKMRFMLLEQFACLFIVYLTSTRWKVATLLKLGSGIAVLALLFNITTAIKRDSSLGGRSIAEELISTADAFATRAGSFQADGICIASLATQGLFLDKSALILAEIAAGLPFTGMINSQSSDSKVSFDMAFHRQHSKSFSEASIFVSGLTAVRFALGFWLVWLAAVLFGFLHGCLVGQAGKLQCGHAWVVSQAMLLTIGLNGLSKSDLLGVVTRFVLFTIAVKICLLRQTRNEQLVMSMKTVFESRLSPAGASR